MAQENNSLLNTCTKKKKVIIELEKKQVCTTEQGCERNNAVRDQREEYTNRRSSMASQTETSRLGCSRESSLRNSNMYGTLSWQTLESSLFKLEMFCRNSANSYSTHSDWYVTIIREEFIT